MNQSALPGVDFGVGQAESHLKRQTWAIGMQQFTKDALITGLEVNAILYILENNQGSPLLGGRLFSCQVFITLI
jgi:hypothetical protein